MALETGDYLDDLSANNPTGTDQKAFGDDHIRLIKKVLRQTLTKADGSTPWDEPLNVDPTDVSNGYVPVGGIIIWSGAISAIPTNWALCNGTANSAGSGIDLTNKFVIGAEADTGGNHDVGDTGGSATAGVITSSTVDLSTTDAHTLTVDEIPAHTHTVSAYKSGAAGLAAGGAAGNTATITSSSTGGGTGHSHNITGGNHSHTVSPPYYALAYIERIT